MKVKIMISDIVQRVNDIENIGIMFRATIYNISEHL
jgi:hypothetical protein